jgi:hypothetical protein
VGSLPQSSADVERVSHITVTINVRSHPHHFRLSKHAHR